MDLYESGHRDMGELQKALSGLGIESLPISAKTSEGLDKLRDMIQEKWMSYRSLEAEEDRRGLPEKIY
jgi:50S ribosomal subunit-associated GTPase HflX